MNSLHASQPRDTVSHVSTNLCLHSLGSALCTYLLWATEQARNAGEGGLSIPRPMTLARKLLNLTKLALALSPLLYQILRYNPKSTHNIV